MSQVHYSDKNVSCISFSLLHVHSRIRTGKLPVDIDMDTDIELFQRHPKLADLDSEQAQAQIANHELFIDLLPPMLPPKPQNCGSESLSVSQDAATLPPPLPPK